MVHWLSREPGSWPFPLVRKGQLHIFICAAALALLGDERAWATPASNIPSPNNAFFVVLSPGILVLAIFVAVIRKRFQSVRGDLKRAKELVEYREYERNLAQQELVRRLEQERELAKEKLQFESQLAEYEKYASLAQLALGAAHEINNPLLGIMSHLELERKQTSGEERMEVEQCIEGAKRISSAVCGLLDYARPGPLLLGKVSLFRLVSETLKFVEHQPMFRNLTLANLVPLDLPPITADVNQLSQILMNLLLNAAQATPPGGSITVGAELKHAAGVVELRVSDSGNGIPADILPHVFEPFFTTKRGQGTGLGLSISQTYVRSHGGAIRVETVEGFGTTVRVTLPADRPGEPAAEYVEVID